MFFLTDLLEYEQGRVLQFAFIWLSIVPDLAIYADTVRVFLITKLQKKLYEGELAQQKHQFLVFCLPPTQIGLRNRAFQKCFPIWKRHPGVLDWTAKRKMKTDLCVKLNVKASWIPRRTTWVFFKR